MGKTTNRYAFQQPTTVLRYLPQEIEWHKAEYRALKSHLPPWEEQIVLHNGAVRDGRLLLQKDIWQTTATLPTDTLLLRGLRSADWLTLWPQRHHLPHFLELRRDLHTQEIWVTLRDDYYPHFGSFRRAAFDIVPLLPGQCVGIDINARYWHSLTGRSMDTHYLENYLYLEHLGTFEQAELVDSLDQAVTLQPDKRVDLRKMMY